MDKKLLIAKPVAEELKIFNSYYKDSIFCNNARIQEIIDYIMKSDGKRIRPTLLLLAAKACGEINNVTYNAAITVELLHTASLIHDDVVDESKIRRGMASINAIYDNKMAVLAGDYFLSTALIKSVLTGNMEIISNISDLGRDLAEGELNQLSLVKELILDEEEYFEVIKKKTASLMSVCMRVGAMSVDAVPEVVEKFTKLGELLGLCFQLRDDIFDYFTNAIGKPTGNDIREGKVTLPLLYAIRNAPENERTELLTIINSYNYTDENIQKLISYAKEHGGIEYAYRKIEEIKLQAEALIAEVSNTEVREALEATVDYIVERAY
ncbi:octaprenyl-diphosphate synthase [Dysgonomonas sp. PFB1-18]|uniref:polyprenyl synthetase family protein n=1 Tax=unclassified Dysgonomonas TaxID=2630389 RepID=UPI002473EA59|nr:MULTISPECIES: polyprenyl synthetase family protein [unclassified Dysgonomonas]MDH6310393.1 octaprenyl-diphosphate synthase [Dysgonomonas sp. PF1-14]MDH6340277.1 octaprenyl-diphosphate synthase [Dysgonomonas sp. PF1-16]MDH6381943.1 octaprenyl-diphosphate synthase [Dysgonomonas sp. PFB1-18]MDH6399248.1 octaprenyl-diphosphate synthase [Dysgonomonas sp. PF1-23]